MKKNGMKVMAVIGSAVMAAVMLAGCGNSGAAATTAATATTAKQTTEAMAEETTKEAATEAKSADADLSGSISMVGSTSMEKFANALSEAFMEKYASYEDGHGAEKNLPTGISFHEDCCRQKKITRKW